MIVEMRTYTMVAGRVNAFLSHYDRLGKLPQWEILGEPLGYFTCESGTLNQVVHIWQFTDHADRDERRARLYADGRWAEFLKQADGLVLKQETRFLRPVAFSD